MKSPAMLLVSVLLFSHALAQDSTKTALPGGKTFTVHVFTMENLVIKGILQAAGDNGITVGEQKGRTLNYVSFTPEQIKTLYLRKKGNVGLGALIGGVAGIGIGAIIGYSTKEESPCNPCYFELIGTKKASAAVGGTIGLISGAGIGMIIGSLTKKQFIIKGKRENYKARFNDIVEKAMTQQ
jgi:hypothetical protein